jgi:regulatory protein
MTLALDLSGAKSYALRLIKFRPRSEKEIRDKLRLKGFDPSVMDQAVGSLKNTRLIDDALFARLWVEGRIKRPLGIARLRLELGRKGVPGNIIEETLSRAAVGYDEDAVIRGLIEKKARQFKGLPEDKAKARIYGFLVRRGFSRDRVMEMVIGLSD